MNTSLELSELVSLAKKKSPFYRKLYSKIRPGKKGRYHLKDLPLVQQSEFWKANTLENNQLLSAPFNDGIVFKSGGTTGNPKFSVFSLNEWNLFTKTFARGLAQGGLKSGERVANLFYGGELYASFLFIMKSIEHMKSPPIHYPLSGSCTPETILKTVMEHHIDVLAGVPTTFMNIINYYEINLARYGTLPIKKVLFGGESMYPDQRKRLQQLLPQVKIQSIGYASVDAGPLGFVDPRCKPDEHRVFGSETILEIINEENGEVIEDSHRPGIVVLTNLQRTLMPIIRYPAGDRAQWVEPIKTGKRDRKFVILGRSEEAARVGPVSIYYEDVRQFFSDCLPDLQISQFQLVIRHFEHRDELTLRLAFNGTELEKTAAQGRIREEYYHSRPMFKDQLNKGIIHPLQIEWATPQALETNPRTGKLRRVIDCRKA